MKITGTLGCLIMMGVAFSTVAEAAEGRDFLFLSGIEYNTPSDDDIIDSGVGIAFKARAFDRGRWGGALAAGISFWDTSSSASDNLDPAGLNRIARNDVNGKIRADNTARGVSVEMPPPRAEGESGPLVVPYASSANVTSARLSGDVYTFPVGPSVYYKLIQKPSFEVLLEGGVRYVVVDSRVEVSGNYTSSSQYFPASSFKKIVDFDDAIIGRVGVEILKRFSDNIAAFFAVGYQFDLKEAKVDGRVSEFLDDLSLENFSVEGGIGIKY